MTAGSSPVRALIALLILSLFVSCYTWLQNTRLKADLSRLAASLQDGQSPGSMSRTDYGWATHQPVAHPLPIHPGNTNGTHASPVPAPDAKDPQQAWLAGFDRAMDQEFRRLETREQAPRDEAELATIRGLKTQLLKLDELYAEIDATPPGPRHNELQGQAQVLLGELIRMSRADRNQRLSILAHELGLESDDDITRWIEAVDEIYAETFMDWPSLFSRQP